MTLDERLRRAVAHAYAHAPATRARFDAAGLAPHDIHTLADLNRLPILPKDEVVRLQQADPPFAGMLAAPLADLRHIFVSPGPLYEPDTGEDATILETAGLALAQAGFVAGDVVLNCLSYHLVPAGLLFDRALTANGCTVAPGGVGNADLLLKVMADLGVTAYVGTPSFLIGLINRAAEQGLDFRAHFRLRKALVTAEPLPEALRQTLVDTHGVAVANAYATAELGILALNLSGGMAMQLMPAPIIQVAAPDTGQPVAAGEAGEVVVTNFDPAYPLIRFGTGDMAVLLDPKPGQSAQEQRAIVLVGRSGEAVKVRGMFVHPNQLRFAAAQAAAGGRVQGVVTRPGDRDHFLLRVEAEETPALAEALKAAVQQVCRVRVDAVEFLPPNSLPADARGMVDERGWG